MTDGEWAGTPHPFTFDRPGAAIVPHPFDLRYGVDTSGLIDSDDLPTPHPNSIWSTAYYGVAPSVFEALIQKAGSLLHPDWRDYTFLDLGSGKGRALMLASRFPFKRIVGVELSPELNDIAKANVVRFAPGDDRIEATEGDATRLDLPDGPLVVNVYNSFLPRVLEACLKNLVNRDVILLYIVPEHEALVDAYFPKLWSGVLAMNPEDAGADRFSRTEESAAIYASTGFV